MRRHPGARAGRPLLAAALLSLLAACAAEGPPRNMVVLLPDADGKVGAVTVSNQKGARTLDQANVAADLAGAERGDLHKLEQGAIKAIFGRALDAEPPAPLRFELYFEFGSDRLTTASQNDIPRIFEAMQERRGTAPEILVIGHTDRVGTPDANFKLGLERAQLVRRILVESGGDPKLMEATSYGENAPLVPTADGAAEPRNRRVEVSIR